MSRQGLKDFLYAVEHSYLLRTKLKACLDRDKILELATDYGFCITTKDLKEDEHAKRVQRYFKLNQIPPLKKL